MMATNIRFDQIYKREQAQRWNIRNIKAMREKQTFMILWSHGPLKLSTRRSVNCKAKRGSETRMDDSKVFVPSEDSIRQIIRNEIRIASNAVGSPE